MATISFKTRPYGDGSYDVFAYTNEHESTIIKDCIDYTQELKRKEDEAKSVGRVIQGETIAGVLCIIKLGYKPEELQDIFSLLNKAIKIKLDDPEREAKIKALLPFVDKWDINSSSFNKELWEETEFLNELIKDNHDIYLLAKEAKSGRVLSSKKSAYNEDND